MDQKLMDVVKEITGKKKPEIGISIILTESIQSRINRCRSGISRYEKKYGMNFKKFHQKLGKDFELSWENEKDYMAWEEMLTNLKYFQKEHAKLKSPNATRIR